MSISIVLRTECGYHILLTACGHHNLHTVCGYHNLLTACGHHNLLTVCGYHNLLTVCGYHNLLTVCGYHNLLTVCGHHKLFTAVSKVLPIVCGYLKYCPVNVDISWTIICCGFHIPILFVNISNTIHNMWIIGTLFYLWIHKVLPTVNEFHVPHMVYG